MNFNKRKNVVLAAIWYLATVSCAGANSDWIEYDSDRLSVNFDTLALTKALARTTQETGVVFSISPGAIVDQTIDIQFDQRSLEDGIRRILDGYNFMMLYQRDDDGHKRIGKVIILGKAEPKKPYPSNVVGGLQTSIAPDSKVILARDRSGHYLAPGTINGQAAEFLLDTGATVVALSDEFANRIGLSYGAKKRIETANGATTGYATVLGQVQLGKLYLEQVPAVIMPQMNLGQRVLLGMSFLGAFDRLQRDNILTIKPRHR